MSEFELDNHAEELDKSNQKNNEMPAKMMRIAGRGGDGTAKAIKADNSGHLQIKDTITRQLFSRRTINGKESIETGILDGEGFQYSTLRFRMANGCQVFVRFYHLNWQNEYVPIGDYEMIYAAGLTPTLHKFDIELKTNYYSIRFTNMDSTGTYFNTDNFETLSNLPLIEPPGESPEEPSAVKLVGDKKPSGSLVFESSSLNVRVACASYDGFYYVVDNSGTLKKYDSIKAGAELIETGISLWDSIGISGRISYLIHSPEGFAFFVNSKKEDNIDEALIYHSTGINEVPSLVYRSNIASNAVWSVYFGVKTYYNGVTSNILAGVYGAGQDNRDLLLSTNGGRTFNVIKKTSNRSADNSNSHWHDVAFDPYSGRIWASEGDNIVNSGIHYSDDLGETWNTLPGVKQPTAIIPFPDMVAFGRDSGLVGLDYALNPKTLDERFEEPRTLEEFRNFPAWKYYAKAPIVNGNEAYMAFHLYDDAKIPLIVGTGDFGKSWYPLYVGTRNIGNFFHVDDEYVYAYDEAHTTVLYAKKPKWM